MRFYFIVFFVVLFILASLYLFIDQKQDSIKIGLLYSKSGTMKNGEKTIQQMLNFAVEELNQKGGLLNKKVTIVEYDGASNPVEFEKGAKYLIDNGVKVIFGCWTSASRKVVKPIVEKNDAILFYPVQYEGVESSKNIIYLGATPNQQINPTITFIEENYGEKIYIVGSNYIYPRMTKIYIDELSKLTSLDVVGYDFKPLGSDNFQDTIKDIIKLKPDAIINLINGSSNEAFFKELYTQGITSDKIPVFSTSIDENSISNIPTWYINGHYSVWSYFNSINNDKNKQLKKRLQQRYGEDFKITDAGYNTYIGFELYKRAVLDTKRTDIISIKNSLKMDSLNTVSGIVYVDFKNNHTYKNMKIAKMKDGEFSVIWKSNILTSANSYPSFKIKKFWNEKERELFVEFGSKWQSDKEYGSEK